MHTQGTEFEGSGTCRIRDKLSGPQFVAGLSIEPRLRGQVNDMRWFVYYEYISDKVRRSTGTCRTRDRTSAPHFVAGL